jgi:hypothetical protein
MTKKKFKLIVISPPYDYKREIICDDVDYSSSGYYYFYNIDDSNRRKILSYYPIVNTIIESIEDLTEIKEGENPKEEVKIINEVKEIKI